MRTPMVAGNWKMNGCLQDNQDLLTDLLAQQQDFAGVEVAVLPPAIYLPQVAELLQDSAIAYGGQNICNEEAGAFTGETAAAMLTDFGSRYVLIGHSERRQLYGETNELVAEKFTIAQKFGLTPILCVGESLSEREADETFAVINDQLQGIIARLGITAFAQAVIAYEPVWAIGTGKSATAEQAEAVHAFIREQVAAVDSEIAQQLTILYGGSVKPQNAAELFAMANIDGGLIGGASLQARDFVDIVKSAG